MKTDISNNKKGLDPSASKYRLAVKTGSPHFMSPTVSSSQQASLKAEKATDRMAPYLPIPSVKARRTNWVASAAKRVGLNRVSDGIPRSRKGHIIKAIKPADEPALSSLNGSSVTTASSSASGLPALATSSSHSGLPVAAASNAALRRVTPLSQKPLPSPPVARAGTISPTKAGRSLLDASEKPLRRSPPGMPHKQEEWPTLTPRKTSKSSASNKCDHQENLLGSSYATSPKLGQTEKFPAFSAPSHSKPGSEGSAISREESRVKEGSEISMASVASEHVRPDSLTIPIDAVDLNAALLQRSSIHVSHHSVSSTMSRNGTQQTRSTGSDDTYVSCSKIAYSERSVQGKPAENYVLQELVNLPTDISHGDAVNGTLEGTKLVKPLPSLEAIEESPKADFEVKRLSIASSNIGPTLKIFKSAENLIMGTKHHEDDHSNSSQGRNSRHISIDMDFHQQGTLETPVDTDFQQQHFENITSIRDMSNGLVGPSRLDFLPKSSKFNRVDNKKSGKTKSADLGYSLSTNHLHRRSGKSKTPTLRKTESFSADDPFFDRRPLNNEGKDCSSASTVQLSVPKQWKDGISAEGEPGMSPLLGRSFDSSDNQVKGKCVQRQFTTEAQLYKDPGMSSRSTCNIDSPREVSDPAESNATIIHHENLTEKWRTTPAQAYGMEVDSRHIFPPRSSSHTMPVKYTKSAETPPVSPWVMHEPQEAGFFNPQSDHESFVRDTSALLDIGNGESKRGSVARESSKSHGSSSKGVISNIRSFFNKHTSSSGSIHSAKPIKKDNLDVTVAGSGSSLPIFTEIRPANRRTLSSANQPTHTEGRIDVNVRRDRPASPSAASLVPDDIGATMATAMQLLDSVRMEENSPQKERRLELGTIMVQAITQAKEAEKAMEEAKHAARKADVAFILCKKSVREIAIWVERWRQETGSE